MPAEQRRSLRRSGSIGAFGLVWLACLVPVSFAADGPAPDPPPLAVAPDPQPTREPADRVVAAPRRPRQAPVVVHAPAAQSVVPAPATRSVTPAVVSKPVSTTKPVVKKQPARAARKPAPAQLATPVPSARRDVWQLRRAAVVFAVEAEPLERRRFALAGVALALVAVGGGIVLGVGGRTLREATS